MNFHSLKLSHYSIRRHCSLLLFKINMEASKKSIKMPEGMLPTPWGRKQHLLPWMRKRAPWNVLPEADLKDLDIYALRAMVVVSGFQIVQSNWLMHMEQQTG
jgi:hypothetical protein